jgi:polar amino acid transport system permease protein
MNIWDFWPSLLAGGWLTIVVTFTSFGLGLVIAVFITAARQSRVAFLRWLGTAYVEILRGIPPLPWMFVVFFALPEIGIKFDPVTTGILVFGLISGAYLTEIYRSGLRAIPQGQFEASAAIGLNKFTSYRHIIVPQAIKVIFPMAVSYLIGLLKDSALVSVIGVRDITTLAIVQGRTHDPLLVFFSAALLYFAISLPIGLIGRAIERRFNLPRSSTFVRATRVPASVGAGR